MCPENGAPSPEGRAPNYSQPSDVMFVLLGSGLAWELSPLPSLLFLPFGGMCILCLPHHCILETHNLFDFTGSQLEGVCLRMNYTLCLTHI